MMCKKSDRQSTGSRLFYSSNVDVLSGGLIDLLVGLVTAHLADGVLEHYILLEQVVNGDFVLGVVVHRALEEEAQEALSAIAACAVSEVHEQTQVEAQGSCQDRVAALILICMG